MNEDYLKLKSLYLTNLKNYKELLSTIDEVCNTPDKKKTLIQHLAQGQNRYDIEIREKYEPSGFDIWNDRGHIEVMLEEVIGNLQKILNNLKKKVSK